VRELLDLLLGDTLEEAVPLEEPHLVRNLRRCSVVMPDDIPQSFEIGGAGYPGPLDNTGICQRL